jgi:hypothetical protein
VPPEVNRLGLCGFRHAVSAPCGSAIVSVASSESIETMIPDKAPDRTERSQQRLALLFPVDNWHRFVSAICFLACVGSIWMGVLYLIGWETAQAGESTEFDMLRGVNFTTFGILGCRYLIRQFRAPRS